MSELRGTPLLSINDIFYFLIFCVLVLVLVLVFSFSCKFRSIQYGGRQQSVVSLSQPLAPRAHPVDFKRLIG